MEENLDPEPELTFLDLGRNLDLRGGLEAVVVVLKLELPRLGSLERLLKRDLLLVEPERSSCLTFLTVLLPSLGLLLELLLLEIACLRVLTLLTESCELE